eukprot:jgi/Picsp_1/184/NSC_00184-R1_protein
MERMTGSRCTASPCVHQHTCAVGGVKPPGAFFLPNRKPAKSLKHYKNKYARMIICRNSENRDEARSERQVFTSEQRVCLDMADDREFYSIPRLVEHSDDLFRRDLSRLYEKMIPDTSAFGEQTRILDLCSSHVSHLPKGKQYSVVGHGMNAVELGRNPDLDSFFIRDLNKDPGDWAMSSNSVDAVLCCCSIQYLRFPEKVMQEIRRVLKPGGICIISFTNRMFYQKAIRAWRDNTEYGRVQLVKQYFDCVGGFSEPQLLKQIDWPDSIWGNLKVSALKALKGGQRDPFYAVISYKLLND